MLLLLLPGSPAALSSELQYLKKSESFCDTSGVLCMHGTISYRVNPRLLQLRARVVKAPGPGRVTINVVGTNRLNHLRRAAIEVSIRGRSSEIVNTEMIPDAPDVYEWELVSIRFDAG
jgi:hypothetical protein